MAFQERGIGYFALKDASLLSMGILGLEFDDILCSYGHRFGGVSSLWRDLNFLAVICAFGLVGALAPSDHLFLLQTT